MAVNRTNKNTLAIRRLTSALLLLMVTPLGFWTKFYSGVGEEWINQHAGGLLYVVFFCLLVFLLFPKSRPLVVALAVLIATGFLETLQLWRPPFLEKMRSFFLGRTLLGNSFSWHDIVWYVGGSVTGFVILSIIRKFSELKQHPSDR